MKAQGLPISTIILAVIGLFVLVIIIYLAGSRLGAFGKGIVSCEQKGGECMPAASDCLAASKVPLRDTSCEQENRGVCCLSLGE